MYTVPNAVSVDITVHVEHHNKAKEHDCFDEERHLREIKATRQLIIRKKSSLFNHKHSLNIII